MVVVLAHLHEVEPALEVIDDLLVAGGRPPLDGVVVLAARGEEPEARRAALHGPPPSRTTRALPRREVHVALEQRGLDLQAQHVVQVLDEAVDEVVGRGVAAIDQRVVAVDRPRTSGSSSRRGVRWGLCSHRSGQEVRTSVRKRPGIAGVQVAHGRRQHQDVARRLEVAEDQLAHRHHSSGIEPRRGTRGFPPLETSRSGTPRLRWRCGASAIGGRRAANRWTCRISLLVCVVLHLRMQSACEAVRASLARRSLRRTCLRRAGAPIGNRR